MSEKCNSCEQMRKENTLVRKALVATDKNYLEVVNENLALKRELEASRSIAFPPERTSPPLKLKCAECNGTGKISMPYVHPTNSNLDEWREEWCGTCDGKGNPGNRSPWFGMPLCVHGYQNCSQCHDTR